MITVLYRAGLRINEALELRPKDLDSRNGAIRVLFAKGGRSRTVGMDGQAFDALIPWLEIRTDHGINGRDPVFCMLDGRPLADSYNVETSWRIATGIISILAAVLASLQTFLGFSDLAAKHRQAGSLYGSVKREIQEKLVVYHGNTSGLNQAITGIRERMDALAEETPQVPARIWKAVTIDFPSKENAYYIKQQG